MKNVSAKDDAEAKTLTMSSSCAGARFAGSNLKHCARKSSTHSPVAEPSRADRLRRCGVCNTDCSSITARGLSSCATSSLVGGSMDSNIAASWVYVLLPWKSTFPPAIASPAKEGRKIQS
jgi:hypothetical protein